MVDSNKEFDDLERELRESLAPRAAPLGFANKVMARVELRDKSAFSLWRWFTSAALVTAVLLAMVLGGRWQQQRRQRIAGERARDQVILALRITGSTLQAVQQKVQQSAKESQP
ncbi:MAG TPA: hypothetical protein VFW25_14700 [Silvibacterium sp.]|nr:hypothetical protein [Silvibacterium sp.]